MTYIIYTRDRVHGYGFKGWSEDFPPEYERRIQEVCGRVDDPQGVARNSIAIRYSPVGERYLFSVIFRKPHGDATQNRGYNTVVHLLFSAEEADQLFAQPTDRMLRQMVTDATRIVSEGAPAEETSAGKEAAAAEETCAAEEYSDWDEKLRKFGVLEPDGLLAGAAFSEIIEGDRPKQLFVALDGDPLQELKTLMCHLPRPLRKQVCFHTGIIGANESRGIALNFATIESLNKIKGDDYNRGQSSDKFEWSMSGDDWSNSAEVAAAAAYCAVLKTMPAADFLKPLLMETVSDWATWRAWRDVKEEFCLKQTLVLIPVGKVKEKLSASDTSRAVLEQLSKCGIQEVARCANEILCREEEKGRKEKEQARVQIPDKIKLAPIDDFRPKKDRETREAEAQAAAETVVELQRTKCAGWGGKARRIVSTLIRLMIVLALLALLVFVLRGFVWTDTMAEDKTVILIISASQAADFVRLLASMGLTAAITALVTVWAVKSEQSKK